MKYSSSGVRDSCRSKCVISRFETRVGVAGRSGPFMAIFNFSAVLGQPKSFRLVGVVGVLSDELVTKFNRSSSAALL